MEKKRVEVEALLQWAYRQELPKTGRGSATGPGTGSAWGMVASFGELHALVDTWNDYGCVPDWHATEEPHPDAIKVHAAVQALSGLGFLVPDGFDVLPEVTVMTPEERADCHGRGLAIARFEAGRTPAIVTSCAMLGRRPTWQAAVVERRDVRGPNGRPRWVRTVRRADGLMVRVDGINKRGKPYPDAVRLTRLEPDPVAFVVERVEYQAYVLALDEIGRQLAGRLDAWSIEAGSRSLAPWMGEGEHPASSALSARFSTGAQGRRAKAS